MFAYFFENTFVFCGEFFLFVLSGFLWTNLSKLINSYQTISNSTCLLLFYLPCFAIFCHWNKGPPFTHLPPPDLDTIRELLKWTSTTAVWYLISCRMPKRIAMMMTLVPLIATDSPQIINPSWSQSLANDAANSKWIQNIHGYMYSNRIWRYATIFWW